MITRNGLHKYWSDRAERQGKLTVGLGGKPLDIQDKQHLERVDFIFGPCPTKLKTLDFGCGIGRYSELFDNYLGLDITEKLLDIAKEEHPAKRFKLITKQHNDGIGLPVDLDYPFELFFTATVLQHNPDDVVLDIFKSVHALQPKGLTFALYENVSVHADHVFGRTGAEYTDLLSNFYSITSSKTVEHIIHGEQHALTLIEVAL